MSYSKDQRMFICHFRNICLTQQQSVFYWLGQGICTWKRIQVYRFGTFILKGSMAKWMRSGSVMEDMTFVQNLPEMALCNLSINWFVKWMNDACLYTKRKSPGKDLLFSTFEVRQISFTHFTKHLRSAVNCINWSVAHEARVLSSSQRASPSTIWYYLRESLKHTWQFCCLFLPLPQE